MTTKTKTPTAKKVTLKKLKKTTTNKKAASVKKNVQNIKNKEKKQKDLTYFYPKGMEPHEKKQWRQSQRNKRNSFIKQIAKAEDAKEKANLIKDAKDWAKTVFTTMPQFD